MNYQVWDITRDWKHFANDIVQLEQVFGPDAWDKDRLLEHLPKAKRIIGILDDDKKLVGYVATETSWLKWRAEYIWILVVDPSVQGKGLGSMLIEEVKWYARGKELTLHVRRDNAPAIALYKKRGFYEADSQPYRYADRTDGIMFKIDRKPLF